MRVDPAREGAAHLLVAELATGDVVAVKGNPADVERPDRQTEYDAATVTDATLARQHGHGRPGRRQALEGARALVPGEERVRRRGHRRAFDEGGRRHAVAGMARRMRRSVR
jgi:hypothetical protein